METLLNGNSPHFRLQEEFFDLAKSPSLLTDLKENVRAVESRWAKVLARLDRRLTDLRDRLPAPEIPCG